jgi:hypothetical protein
MSQQMPAMQRPNSAVPPETYYRFQAEAARLPQPERQVLARRLEEDRLKAKRAGDLDREVHYLRLLNILQRTP